MPAGPCVSDPLLSEVLAGLLSAGGLLLVTLGVAEALVRARRIAR
jgi:hypothetical protein